MAALEAVDLDAPWERMASLVRPVLPRRRPLPPGGDPVLARSWPPGIAVALGLDIGPAILFVVQGQLTAWGASADEAFEAAEANVRRRCLARRPALVLERVAGLPVRAFQSREGWAASLVLFPDLLERVLGRGSAVVLAPMRDLLVALPIDTDPAVSLWLLESLAETDPNALDIPPLALVDGRVTLAPLALPDAPGRPA